jgi:hypothetical protein
MPPNSRLTWNDFSSASRYLTQRRTKRSNALRFPVAVPRCVALPRGLPLSLCRFRF